MRQGISSQDIEPDIQEYSGSRIRRVNVLRLEQNLPDSYKSILKGNILVQILLKFVLKDTVGSKPWLLQVIALHWRTPLYIYIYIYINSKQLQYWQIMSKWQGKYWLTFHPDTGYYHYYTQLKKISPWCNFGNCCRLKVAVSDANFTKMLVCCEYFQ